jgi:hypothetical protein
MAEHFNGGADSTPNNSNAASPVTNPRKREELLRAQLADLDLREGDGRGVVFFSEIAVRKGLAAEMHVQWVQLEVHCCTSMEGISAMESASRSHLMVLEQHRWEGLQKWFRLEFERVLHHYVDHSYINYLMPPNPNAEKPPVTPNTKGSAATVPSNGGGAVLRPITTETLQVTTDEAEDRLRVVYEETEGALGLSLMRRF